MALVTFCRVVGRKSVCCTSKKEKRKIQHRIYVSVKLFLVRFSVRFTVSFYFKIGFVGSFKKFLS